MKKLLSAVAAAAFATVSFAGAASAQATDYVLNTASTGGTDHPVGVAWSTQQNAACWKVQHTLRPAWGGHTTGFLRQCHTKPVRVTSGKAHMQWFHTVGL